MRRRSFTLLLLVSFSGPATGQSAPPRVRDVCAQDVQVTPPLVRYESRGGRFSVILPRLPDAKNRHDEQTDLRIQLHHDETVYVGQRSDAALPALSTDATNTALDRIRDGAAANVQGSIDREERIRCGKAAGREFVVLSKTRDAASRTRIFIAGPDSYLVSFTTHRGKENSRAATAFLDSFRIYQDPLLHRP